MASCPTDNWLFRLPPLPGIRFHKHVEVGASSWGFLRIDDLDEGVVIRILPPVWYPALSIVLSFTEDLGLYDEISLPYGVRLIGGPHLPPTRARTRRHTGTNSSQTFTHMHTAPITRTRTRTHVASYASAS